MSAVLTNNPSYALKKCVRSCASGPPNEYPMRAWVNGGVLVANALVALSA